MIKIKLRIAFVLCIIMMLACAKEEIGIEGTSSEKVSIVLALDIPTSEIVTRSTADEDAARENSVKNLDVLFFDAAGANSANPLFSKRYTIEYVTTVETGRLRAVLKDMPIGTYMVMVVANGENGDFTILREGVTTLAQAKTTLVTKAGTSMPSTFIPMAGVSNGTETITQDNQLLRTITLYRTVGRFDLHCELASLAENSFELLTAEVRNARTAGYFFGQFPLTEKDHVAVPSSAGITDYVREELSGDMLPHAVNGKIEAQLYAFENSVSDPEAKREETTCIILGGKFNKSGQITYYRVNLQNGNNKYVVKRNHRYIIKILSVVGPGYGTKDEAEQGLINNLKVEIESWIDDASGITVEGNQMMSVSQTDFQFEKMSVNATGRFTVRLKNIDPNTFYIEREGDAQWVTIDETGSFTKGADNIWSRTYSYRISENNTTPDTRTQSFMLRHSKGALYLKINFEQLNSSRINLVTNPQELPWSAVTAHRVEFNFGNANHDDPTAGLKWSVSSLTPWLKVNATNPSTGRGAGSFYVDLEAFTDTGFSRQGTIRMTLIENDGNRLYYDVSIRQFAYGTVLEGLTFDRVQLSLKIPDEGYPTSKPYVIKVSSNTTHTIETEKINPSQWSFSMLPIATGYKLSITATPVPDRSTTDDTSTGTCRIGYLHFKNAKGERVRTLMLYQGYVKDIARTTFYVPGRNVKYSDHSTYRDGNIPNNPDTLFTYDLVAHGQRVWLDRNINAMRSYYGIEKVSFKDAIGTIFYNPHSDFYKHENPLVDLSNRVYGPCPAGFRIANSTDVKKMKFSGSGTIDAAKYSQFYVDDMPLLLKWVLLDTYTPLYNEKQGTYFDKWYYAGIIHNSSEQSIGVIRCVSEI